MRSLPRIDLNVQKPGFTSGLFCVLGPKIRPGGTGVADDRCRYLRTRYNLREGTKDVDAVFQPREQLQPLIAEVAQEMNLDPDWLNDHVGQFAPNDGGKANVPFERLTGIPGISIFRPTAKKMLAMKARAARLPRPGHGGDLHDLAFLIRHCGLKSIEEVDQVFNKFYGDSLDSKQRLVADRALELSHASDQPKTEKPA